MESQSILIELKDAQIRRSDFPCKKAFSWTMRKGEHWAIIGPNASGKTLFVDILTGRHPLRSGSISYPCFRKKGKPLYEAVKLMAFRDIFSLSSDYKNSAYQQRWNSQESESAPFVRDQLTPHSDKAYTEKIFDVFGIRPMLSQRLIELSGGELRKFLLAKTLLSRPEILILDNPYIGLDVASRNLLDKVLTELADLDGLQLIFVVSAPKDIPPIVNRVQAMEDCRLLPAMDKFAFLHDNVLLAKLFPQVYGEENALSCAGKNLLPVWEPADFVSPGLTRKHLSSSIEKQERLSLTESSPEEIVSLNAVNIRYGERQILKDLHWRIKSGEKWALLGGNGSGKSTLLSLLCADNPQAYANDIRLFGCKRGSGESIWEIKKHIGYLSPEMHHYYLKNIPCIDIVGSGLFDTIGLYKKCKEAEYACCEEIMERFGVAHLRYRSFLAVSFGEQRMCLLARAFVKRPDVLILDEPLHGLDISNKARVRQIINDYCTNPAVTLIYVTHYFEEIPECVDRVFSLSISAAKQS